MDNTQFYRIVCAIYYVQLDDPFAYSLIQLQWLHLVQYYTELTCVLAPVPVRFEQYKVQEKR